MQNRSESMRIPCYVGLYQFFIMKFLKNRQKLKQDQVISSIRGLLLLFCCQLAYLLWTLPLKKRWVNECLTQPFPPQAFSRYMDRCEKFQKSLASTAITENSRNEYLPSHHNLEVTQVGGRLAKVILSGSPTNSGFVNELNHWDLEFPEYFSLFWSSNLHVGN